jgi:hypothetical protein
VANYTNGWPQLLSVKDDLHKLKEGLRPHFDTVDIVQSPTVAEIRAKMREFLLGKPIRDTAREIGTDNDPKSLERAFRKVVVDTKVATSKRHKEGM